MAREQILEADTLPEGAVKLNANADLADALQTAVGVAEEATGVGVLGSDPADTAWGTSDSLRTVLRKHEARIVDGADLTRQSGNARRADRDLGDSYDYKALDAEAVSGATNVLGGAANLADYPAGAKLYHVRSTISGATGAADEDEIRTVVISDGQQVWITNRLGTTWTEPRPVTSVGYRGTLNSPSDWGSAAGGQYTVTLQGAVHKQGNNVDVTLLELDGADNMTPWYGSRSVENTSGDITISCSETPDARVSLRIIVRAH